MHEFNPYLKPKVELMARGLSKLFGVSHQSTNRGKNNSIIGLTDIHWGFATHLSQKDNYGGL